MTEDELRRAGIYADTATFIHVGAHNILHDGNRASLYEMSNGGNDFKLVVQIHSARQMRQIAMAFNYAADLTEAAQASEGGGS